MNKFWSSLWLLKLLVIAYILLLQLFSFKYNVFVIYTQEHNQILSFWLMALTNTPSLIADR